MLKRHAVYNRLGTHFFAVLFATLSISDVQIFKPTRYSKVEFYSVTIIYINRTSAQSIYMINLKISVQHKCI